jgi:hypothetical protein
LAIAWLIPVVIVVVAVPLSDFLESKSVATDDPEFVIVGSRLDDQRTSVNVGLRLGGAPKIRSSAGGTITSVNLAAGQIVSQGDHLVSVDYVPVLAFVSSAPLVRDLRTGDSGPDVTALAAYLRDLGLLDAANVDSKFGTRIRNAVNAFQAGLGIKPDGVFRTAYVAYVPTEFGELEAASVVVGDSLTPGATLATGTPPILAVEIEPTTEGRSLAAFVDAESVLLLGTSQIDFGLYPPSSEAEALIADWVYEVSEDGPSVTDGEMFDTASFEGFAITLKDPIRYGTVPASAVLQSSSGEYCLVKVHDDGTEEVINLNSAVVIGSELGVVGVDSNLIDQQILREVHDASAETLSRCR